MNNVYKFTANLLELLVLLFGLIVGISVLVGFDVIGPLLEALNNTNNLLIAIGLFVLYAVSKGNISE